MFMKQVCVGVGFCFVHVSLPKLCKLYASFLSTTKKADCKQAKGLSQIVVKTPIKMYITNEPTCPKNARKAQIILAFLTCLD